MSFSCLLISHVILSNVTVVPVSVESHNFSKINDETRCWLYIEYSSPYPSSGVIFILNLWSDFLFINACSIPFIISQEPIVIVFVPLSKISPSFNVPE
ncbi:TPA: hypothetical protein DIC40_05050 [Patescibacteria group bacterium]|nr:hypothetical protein [Candidatus Gracilibacteria bacterium]